MHLAVRTAKLEPVKVQLLSSLELGREDIAAVPTNYTGIALLILDESVIISLRSIRNIEVIVLDELTAAALLQPERMSEAPLLKSLDGVDASEQYDQLIQLLYTQNARIDEI